MNQTSIVILLPAERLRQIVLRVIVRMAIVPVAAVVVDVPAAVAAEAVVVVVPDAVASAVVAEAVVVLVGKQFIESRGRDENRGLSFLLNCHLSEVTRSRRER